MAKRIKESAPEENVPAEELVREELAVVPVEEPDVRPEPAPEPVSTPPPVEKGPTFRQRAGGVLKFLVRLLSLLIILGAVSIGLYYVLPRLYQQYLQPVQENTDQLEQLRDQQIQNEQTLTELGARLAGIETAQAGQVETIATLETRLGDLEAGIAAHTETLAQLEQMQATLQSRTDAAGVELEQQIQLLKAMELLSRARLFMYQSNFGLAEQDVLIARNLLAAVQPDAPESLADDLTAVILRLDLTLSNLPNFPVAASDDLDIAWQILLGGLPQGQPFSAGTPIPDTTLTPTTEASLTPTVEATVTVTPTP